MRINKMTLLYSCILFSNFCIAKEEIGNCDDVQQAIDYAGQGMCQYGVREVKISKKQYTAFTQGCNETKESKYEYSLCNKHYMRFYGKSVRREFDCVVSKRFSDAEARDGTAACAVTYAFTDRAFYRSYKMKVEERKGDYYIVRDH